jgi:hypothetical protein
MTFLLEISPILSPTAMIVPDPGASDNAKRRKSLWGRLEMALTLVYKEEEKQVRWKDRP